LSRARETRAYWLTLVALGLFFPLSMLEVSGIFLPFSRFKTEKVKKNAYIMDRFLTRISLFLISEQIIFFSSSLKPDSDLPA